MRNATKGNSVLSDILCSMLKSRNAGATPEVTTSARESSSLPSGDATLSKRAAIPSKKSKKMPAKIAMEA